MAVSYKEPRLRHFLLLLLPHEKDFYFGKIAHLEGAEKEEAIARYRVKMVVMGSNAAHTVRNKIGWCECARILGLESMSRI